MGNVLSVALGGSPPLKESKLLTLPAELRLDIYELALFSTPLTTVPPLLNTNRQIRSECLKIYLPHLDRNIQVTEDAIKTLEKVSDLLHEELMLPAIDSATWEQLWQDKQKVGREESEMRELATRLFWRTEILSLEASGLHLFDKRKLNSRAREFSKQWWTEAVLVVAFRVLESFIKLWL